MDALLIIQLLFQIYLIILILYVLLRASGAHYINPIIQWLVRLSEPLIKPARKLIAEKGKIDWAAWLVILFVQLVEVIILIAMMNLSPNLFGMICYSVIRLAKLVVNIYFYAIIVFAILSWIQSVSNNALNHVLYHLTTPVLQPIKRVLPAMGGIDFSPLVAIIALQIINLLLLNPLLITAAGLLQ